MALVFAVIIVAFMFAGLGPSSRQDAGSRVVAEVGGVDILVEDYEELYRRRLEFYRNSMGDKLTDEFIESLGLRAQAIDALVDRVLVQLAAKAEGIKAGKGEIQDRILRMEVFQREGVFDRDLYLAVLSSNRIKPAAFEHSIKEDILASKIQAMMASEVIVTEDDIRDAFQSSNKELSLEYIEVASSGFINKVETTEDEVRGYLVRSAGIFTEPTRLTAFYAYLTIAEIASGVEVEDEAVSEYYDKNSFEFRNPREVRASHVLIRPAKDARDTADKAASMADARAAADGLLKRVKAGEDFAAIAGEHSEDRGSAARGGDLGFFARGVMVKPFEEAAFNLAAGEISDLVETEYGFHFIKVTEIRHESVKTLEEASGVIREKIVEMRAKRTAWERLSKLYEELKADRSAGELKEAVEEAGATSGVTKLFSETDPDASLASPELKKAAFMQGAGGVSGIVESSGRLYIIKVLTRVEEHVPPLEEIEERVLAGLRKEKAAELAREKATAVLELLRIGGEAIEDVAAREGLDLNVTPMFSKSSAFLPKIGLYLGAMDEIFELTETTPYPMEVFPSGDRFFVFKLKQLKKADPKEYEAKRASIKERLTAELSQEAVEDWIAGLRADAEITIHEELL